MKKQKALGLVDYMVQQGLDYSKSSRSALAKKMGIKDYDFSAAKNIELLNLLQAKPSKTSKATPAPVPSKVGKVSGAAQKLATGKITVPKEKTLESGVVVDKRTGKAYEIMEGKAKNQFDVLTGVNVESNFNVYPSKELDADPSKRATPVGYYLMTEAGKNGKKEYDNNIQRLVPIDANGVKAPQATHLAIHQTYDPATRDQYYGSDTPWQSYGCINCKKPDIKRVLNQYSNDTLRVIDTKNPRDAQYLKQYQSLENGGAVKGAKKANDGLPVPSEFIQKALKTYHKGQKKPFLQLPDYEAPEGLDALQKMIAKQQGSGQLPMPYTPDHQVEVNQQLTMLQEKGIAPHILPEPGVPQEKERRGISASNIGLGLQLINELIPGDPIRKPVVRPQMVYNDRPNGTGSQAIYETGGPIDPGGRGKKKKTFSSQAELDAANAEAYRFSTARNMLPAYAGKNIGDPIPQYLDESGQVYAPQTRNLPKTLPAGITIDQVKTDGALAWYEDPKTGDVVDVDPTLIYQLQHRKPKNVVDQDMASRTARLNNGGQLSNGSELQVASEGRMQPISYNPYAGETIQFQGPSHERGGIDIQFGKRLVEVEGDEVAFKDSEGALQIMGNMVVPGTRQKFKNATKDIARKEMKVAKEKSLASQLMEGMDPRKSADKLTINAAALNMQIADSKQRKLAKKKEDLARLQEAILIEAERSGQDPNRIAEGKPKAKKGMRVTGEDPDESKKKLEAVRQAALKKLQAQYPGQKVDIRMNVERDVREQRALKGKGYSKTSVSLHNFGGAADYNIYVDGKWITKDDPGGLKLYNSVIQAAAKEQGLTGVGDWDPYHVSLVPEGKGKNSLTNLFKKYPNLKKSSRAQDTLKHLEDLVNKGEADPTELNAYKLLSGKNVSASTKAKIIKDYSVFALPDKGKGSWIGENFFEDLPTITQPDPSMTTRINSDGTPVQQQKQDIDYNVEFEGNFNITNPQSRKKGTNVEALRFTQVLPEVVAQATNKTDPVWMQQFTPEMLQPYNISLQDQLNENNASFNGLERMVDDPSSLSILAAQKYQANQKVLGEQFRINQGIEADVIAKNTGTFNDAQLRNLGLADQQYVRQETAKSKTKSLNREILNSVSAKELQHSSSMKRLAAWENMYDYRFVDSNNDGIPDLADYQGPEAQFDFMGPLGQGPTNQKNTETVELDQFGIPVKTIKKKEDNVPQIRINKKGKDGASIPSLYSQMMKKMR
jgi:hypothetical protein